VSSATGESFKVLVPEDYQAQLVVDVMLCNTSHTSTDFSTVQPVLLAISMQNVIRNGASESALLLGMEQQTSMVKSNDDAVCVHLQGRSASLSDSFEFSSLRLQVSGVALQPLRLTRLLASDSSKVAIQLVSNSFNTTFYGRQVVTLQDTIPPLFLTFPSDMSVEAPRWSSEAPVRWAEPVVVDNSGVVKLARSHVPPSMLSIKRSPHQISYTASDRSGLSARKSFTVTVTEPPLAVPAPVFPLTAPNTVLNVTRKTLTSAGVGEHAVLEQLAAWPEGGPTISWDASNNTRV
jgi:hypothetical protein